MEHVCNYYVSNPYGCSLYRYAQRHPQVNVLGPTSPTYVPIHRGQHDVLDIGVFKDLACPIIIEAISDRFVLPRPGTDHCLTYVGHTSPASPTCKESQLAILSRRTQSNGTI